MKLCRTQPEVLVAFVAAEPKQWQCNIKAAVWRVSSAFTDMHVDWIQNSRLSVTESTNLLWSHQKLNKINLRGLRENFLITFVRCHSPVESLHWWLPGKTEHTSQCCCNVIVHLTHHCIHWRWFLGWALTFVNVSNFSTNNLFLCFTPSEEANMTDDRQRQN